MLWSAPPTRTSIVKGLAVGEVVTCHKLRYWPTAFAFDFMYNNVHFFGIYAHH